MACFARLLARPPWRSPGLALVAVGAVLLWSYWPTLASMAQTWSVYPQYSHGYLVPVFAAVLLGVRRRLIPSAARGSWWGVLVLAGAAAVRLAGTYFFCEWFDLISLLPALAGVAVLLGGWPALRWAWPAVAFLTFMVPLPYQLEFVLAWPLQRVATVLSTYALQTFGFPALAEGNVILLGEMHLGVVEACSGLSMLVVFFALAFAVALVIRRPFWQRAALVASAVPIAVVSNVARITLTGVLYQTVDRGFANVFYHDLAGWLMMPVALALLVLELSFLGRLFVRLAPVGPMPLDLAAVPAARPRPSDSQPLRPSLPVPAAEPAWQAAGETSLR